MLHGLHMEKNLRIGQRLFVLQATSGSEAPGCGLRLEMETPGNYGELGNTGLEFLGHTWEISVNSGNQQEFSTFAKWGGLQPSWELTNTTITSGSQNRLHFWESSRKIHRKGQETILLSGNSAFNFFNQIRDLFDGDCHPCFETNMFG